LRDDGPTRGGLPPRRLQSPRPESNGHPKVRCHIPGRGPVLDSEGGLPRPPSLSTPPVPPPHLDSPVCSPPPPPAEGLFFPLHQLFPCPRLLAPLLCTRPDEDRLAPEEALDEEDDEPLPPS